LPSELNGARIFPVAHRHHPHSGKPRTNVLSDRERGISAGKEAESQALLRGTFARHAYRVQVVRIQDRKPRDVRCNDWR